MARSICIKCGDVIEISHTRTFKLFACKPCFGGKNQIVKVDGVDSAKGVKWRSQAIK